MLERHYTLPQADLAGRLSSDQPAIRVTHLAKSYGQTRILRDVDFELEKGKIYSIIGPSGCGKSTLLKIMIGAQKPSAGGVEIDGIDMWHNRDSERNRARRKFGVLFQSGALLNNLTCAENVALPLRQHTDLPESTIRMLVRMKLELVGMGHAMDRKPGELSGGMIKRCALARAIALDPAIVFFDEPSAGIDPVMIAVLDRLVLDLTQKLGITSVVITHEMPSAFRISDEMLMLFGGRIHFRGTPEELRDSPDPAVRQFIHGQADGPISQTQDRSTIARRILGIDDERMKDSAHLRKTRLLTRSELAEVAKESEASRRFRKGHDAVMGHTMELRRTAKLSTGSDRQPGVAQRGDRATRILPATEPESAESTTSRVTKLETPAEQDE